MGVEKRLLELKSRKYINCIFSQVRTEKGVEKRLLEHKTKVKEENCFALMFACCGRGKGLYRGKCPRNDA